MPKSGELNFEDPETPRRMIENYTDDFMTGAVRILLQSCPKHPVALRKRQKQLLRYRRLRLGDERRLGKLAVESKKPQNEKNTT